jgi:hypothetical protein
MQKAIERGAKSIKEPYELSDDNGTVILATIQTVIATRPLLTFVVW